MIPISKPFMDQREVEAASRPLLAGWVTQGPEGKAFEEEFAAFVGASHACAVSSGTTALHLALDAVGVGAGDEVITVSHSYIATANAVTYCGAIPVFADIDPLTFNIDPAAVEDLIRDKTRAILCAHQIGLPCDLPGLLAISQKYEIPLIEDAACAAGSEIQINGVWERIGAPHGDIACFSFHPRKVLTTGDGGMLTTNNAELDAVMRLKRSHAMSVPATNRHNAREIVFEEYPVVGFNYRMTDIQAAVGRVQLERLPEFVARRRELADHYATRMPEGVSAPIEPVGYKTNWQSYCVTLAPELDQKQVLQYLADNGVSARRGIMCAHREPAYAHVPWRAGDLSHSEYAQDHSLCLPLYHQLTEAEMDTVIRVLGEACGG
jgi:dTDP-4-amino-4,6-dideoxygalactose transaminase